MDSCLSGHSTISLRNIQNPVFKVTTYIFQSSVLFQWSFYNTTGSTKSFTVEVQSVKWLP
uniref:Uncharacterized protein n=1 Tax=Rhizophagus irregularis (strain DAOM 181602 / DAOM 197198 / MUCL 43194) TaxID=747089 RepID=U9SQT7_RHIID